MPWSDNSKKHTEAIKCLRAQNSAGLHVSLASCSASMHEQSQADG